MQKVYERINWENYPSTDTPLNETNLNKVDYAVDAIDDRVISLDTTKANQSDFLQSVHSVTLDTTTGILTVTYENGTVYTVDTKLEKIAINFDYDDDPTSAHYQQLIITLDDGTVKYIDMSALVTQYEFDDSTDIAFTVTGGRVSASIKNGSVTRQKIDPDYLAQIDAQVNAAQTAASGAQTSERNSEAWAVGQKNGQDVPSTEPQYHNNAKYYSEQASESVDEAQDILDEIVDAVSMVTFTVDFATGNLIYSSDATYNFSINTTTGNLEWEVVIQ